MSPERSAAIQQVVVGNGWMDSVEWPDVFNDLEPLLATWAEEDRAAGAAEVVARVEAAVEALPASRFDETTAGPRVTITSDELRGALRGDA